MQTVAAAGDGVVVYVSGDDEARLGLLAVAHDPAFAEAERLTIVDVGGHSTEIVTANPSALVLEDFPGAALLFDVFNIFPEFG